MKKTIEDRFLKRLLALCFFLFVGGLVMPAAAGRSEERPAGPSEANASEQDRSSLGEEEQTGFSSSSPLRRK